MMGDPEFCHSHRFLKWSKISDVKIRDFPSSRHEGETEHLYVTIWRYGRLWTLMDDYSIVVLVV